MLKSLGWEDLQTRRRNASFYKISNGHGNNPLSDELVPADEHTRGAHNKNYKHI